MPNQQNVSMTEACKRFDEAMRIILKYQYSAEKEPNALLDPTMDRLNGVYYTNPCMHHKSGEKNISKGLKEFYKNTTDKDPTEKSAVCTAIVTMPKDFMKAHFKIKDEHGAPKDPTPRQYMLLEKYYNEEKLNSYEQEEVKPILDSLVHPQWSEDEQKKIHQFFMATTYIYCKNAGIKGPIPTFEKDENGKDVLNEFGEKQIESLDFEGSDVLWSVSHMSESWPHLHLGFLPSVYLEKKELRETYDEALNERKVTVQKLIDDGTARGVACKETPHVIRPYALDGDLNREIKRDEKPIGCTVKRFRNAYLRSLNSVLEKGLEKEFSIKANIATGAGQTFNMKRQNRDKRYEDITKERSYQLLQAEKDRLETENNRLKEDTTQLTTTVMAKQNELTMAINENEVARAEALTSKEEAEKAKVETLACKYEIEDLKDEFEAQKIEYNEKISEMQQTIINLKTELKNVIDKAAHFVSNILKTFLQKWEKAKTDFEKERIDEEVRTEAETYVKEVVAPLYTFGRKAEELVEEKVDIINGVNMAQFIQTGQRVGVARSQIKKMAERCGKDEVFVNERLMNLALQDWFDREKHEKQIVNRSEFDASLYMKLPNRARRAIDYVLEKAYEMDEDYDRE